MSEPFDDYGDWSPERESTQNLARSGVDNAYVFVDYEHHDSGPRVGTTDSTFVEPATQAKLQIVVRGAWRPENSCESLLL